MSKRVNLPDGKVGIFPDEMSNDEIAAVLRKQYPPPANDMSAAAFSAAPDSAEMGMRMGLGGQEEIDRQASAAATAAPVIATGGIMKLPLVPAMLAGGALGAMTGGGVKGALVDAAIGALPGAGRMIPKGVVAKAVPILVKAMTGAEETAPAVVKAVEAAPTVVKEAAPLTATIAERVAPAAKALSGAEREGTAIHLASRMRGRIQELARSGMGRGGITAKIREEFASAVPDMDMASARGVVDAILPGAEEAGIAEAMKARVLASSGEGLDSYKIARRIQNEFGGPNKVTLKQANNIVDMILRAQ